LATSTRLSVLKQPVLVCNALRKGLCPCPGWPDTDFEQRDKIVHHDHRFVCAEGFHIQDVGPAKIAAGGPVGLASPFGSGMAHADSN
jgi:hypothetical protein